MVHSSFVRKQLLIYCKIILLASFIVYILSTLVSYIPYTRPENRKAEAKDTRTVAAAKRGAQKVYVGEEYETSLVSRWTIYAQTIFGKLQPNTKSELRGSLNVHRWYTVCGNTVDNLRRHVLFPKHPKLRTSIGLLRMRTKLQDFGQRIFGFIHPPLSGSYQFAVSSDDFSEIWLSTDASPNNTLLICQVGGVYKGTFIMGFTRPGQFDKYHSQKSQYIYLDGDQKYYFEVLHKQGRGRGHLHVAWKMPGWKYFTIITSEFISLFMREAYGKSERDDHIASAELVLKHHKHVRTKYSHPVPYKNFTRLSNTTVLPLLRLSQKALPACSESPTVFSKKVKRYQGRFYTQIPNVFPEDGSNFVVQLCQDAKHADECKGNPLLGKDKAYWIAERFFNASLARKYTLTSIIKVEDVQEKQTGDHHYFIEIEIENKVNGRSWRVAEHVVERFVGENLCYPVKKSWNPSVTVYVIITVKNQGIWLRHFVDNMVEIQEQTDDNNLHPIIVDFGSKDIDINNYLKQSGLKSHTGK